MSDPRGRRSAAGPGHGPAALPRVHGRARRHRALRAGPRRPAAPRRPLPGVPVHARRRVRRPGADGASLWTRLAPEPLARAAGCRARDVAVALGAGRATTGFRHVVERGTAAALPELAHSVHVDVRGLEPGREYCYRFTPAGTRSPVGRTKTAPRPARSVNGADVRLRLLPGVAGRLLHGLPAHGRGGPRPRGPPRRLHLRVRHPGATAARATSRCRRPCRRLRDARALPAPARALQDRPGPAGGAPPLPWVVTWDDHEVENDYAGHLPRDAETTPDVPERGAAYQAYFEHMPLRLSALPRAARCALPAPALRRPRRVQRARHAPVPHRPALRRRRAAALRRRLRPGRDDAGRRAGGWLLDGLGARGANWNVLAQGVMMGELKHDAARRPLLAGRVGRLPRPARAASSSDRGDQRGPAQHLNPVVITGDWHSTFVNDLKADFGTRRAPRRWPRSSSARRSRPTATASVYGPYYGPMIPFNPASSSSTATAAATCSAARPRGWPTELRMVEDRRDADARSSCSRVRRRRRGAGRRHRLLARARTRRSWGVWTALPV